VANARAQGNEHEALRRSIRAFFINADIVYDYNSIPVKGIPARNSDSLIIS